MLSWYKIAKGHYNCCKRRHDRRKLHQFLIVLKRTLRFACTVMENTHGLMCTLLFILWLLSHSHRWVEIVKIKGERREQEKNKTVSKKEKDEKKMRRKENVKLSHSLFYSYAPHRLVFLHHEITMAHWHRIWDQNCPTHITERMLGNCARDRIVH